MEHLFFLSRVICTEGSALLPSPYPTSLGRQEAERFLKPAWGSLQRHSSDDCAVLARNEEQFFFLLLNLPFRRRQGPGRWKISNSRPTVASTQHSLHARPPSGICHQCYRKQLLAGLWENGKHATNATVFFKNFCFPESFANPASAPASVCGAVWLGILAETWVSAMPSLLSPMPGLLATRAGVMQRGSPWELTAAAGFLWRFGWSAACMSQPRSLEVMGIGQIWWAHWLFYRPLRLS